MQSNSKQIGKLGCDHNQQPGPATTNKRKKMKERKIVCTYCKSDKIEYVPAPFQGQDTWFDVRYEQQKNGKFKAVIIGDTPEKEREIGRASCRERV